MAIKELFYDQRPIALLDPRASQRIDPRFKFTRNSTGTYFDQNGLLQTVEAGRPRFSYDPATKEYLGLLVEPQRTNIVPTSNGVGGVSSTTSIYGIPLYPITAASFAAIYFSGAANGFFSTTSGKTYTISLYAKLATVNAGTNITGYLITGSGVSVSNQVNKYIPSAGGRMTFTVTATATTGSVQIALIGAPNLNYIIGGFQVEEGAYATSYIPTAGGAKTRIADLISVDAVNMPPSGSVYIDSRAIISEQNSTLLSLKNASNQKINLAMEQRSETYNSLALINTYSGTAKSSLPLPVPTTNRERNIITWGANNYQYTKDSSRFAPSLSTSVPANLTSLSIGHDSVDPTKAFNGYINSVYLYSGEIAPAIAEALVRGELNPVNADTYSPSGPAGSLALVINTQGASASGDKVFALPAESAANDNDLVITWGDGTESALELAAAEVGAAGLSHTYPSAGIYPVWVEGKMQNLYFNNSASAPDLLSIASWGTGQMFTSPSTMNSAFYGCSKLTSIASSGLPNTSAVTSWYRAFRGCSSLTGTFPSFNFSAATTLQEAFYDCSNITSFPSVGNQTQNVTSFLNAWRLCGALTSFPLINTSAGTNFEGAWYNCNSLTAFPLISTSNGTNFSYAWYNCSNIDNIAANGDTTSFPLINTSSGTNFERAWSGCSKLTVFPLINTSSGTNFASAWDGCSALVSFPQINTSSATNLSTAWFNCSSLTQFPTITTNAVTNFFQTWRNCSSLTQFPQLNTGNGTNFSWAWRGCSGLTSFPSIDTSKGTNFSIAWGGCSSMVEFPPLNFNAATGLASDSSTTFTGFREAWQSCTSLTTFPADRFNNTTCTRYLDAFTNCALTAQSIENILVSINAAGTSNGNLSLQGGTNAGASTWTANAVTAYNALVARGWTITRNA